MNGAFDLQLNLSVTFDVFAVCKAAKTNRGETVLISILVVFHAITYECSGFTKITISNQACVTLKSFAPLFGRLKYGNKY